MKKSLQEKVKYISSINRRYLILAAVATFLLTSGAVVFAMQGKSITADEQVLGKFIVKPTKIKDISPTAVKPTASPSAVITPTKPLTPSPSPIHTPIPTFIPTIATAPIATQPSTTSMLFGMGPEADKAMQTRLYQEQSLRMLTSWYNGSNDLAWITQWKKDLVPQSYANGYALHLITFTDLPEGPIDTPYGPSCGRAYPLSANFTDDMRQLAQTFSGSGPLYVTLFTEFQTYPCSDNEWVGSENYYKTLKDQYRKAITIFHQEAPNAKVGLSWGGWQGRWDNPQTGGGRSLFNHFADVMEESDIIAFQAMQSDSNVSDVRDMAKILSQYGKPLMISHYRPDVGGQTVFEADINQMFSDPYLNELKQNRVFAFSFMDTEFLNNSETIYQYVKAAIDRHD
jgi:hypothetical protein